MLFPIKRNQWLFFVHTFIRNFFTAFQLLGWGYLYVQGVPILTVFIAVFCFRILQITLFIPITYWLVQHVSFKLLFFFAIVFQGFAFGSFYFANHGTVFLMFTVILLSIYDSLYYVVKSDIERLTPAKADIAKNVAIGKVCDTISKSIGIVATASVLQFFPQWTFWILFAGGFLSLIPIFLLRFNISVPAKPLPFLGFIFLKKPFWKWINHPIIVISLAGAAVSEFIESLAIFLVHFEVTLIQVGWILAFMKIFSCIHFLFIGIWEDKNKQYSFLLLAITTLCLFIVFYFLPVSHLPWFLLIYSGVGVGWELIIRMIRQRFVRNHIEPVFGGVFDLWLDTAGRSMMYFMIVMSMLATQEVTRVLPIVFGVSALLIFMSLMLGTHAREAIIEND